MSSEDATDERRIHHRRIEPSSETANEDLLAVVAELEACDVEDLPPFWPRIDDVLTHVFSNPPSPEAQIELAFTYAGYRIRVDQTGDVELMEITDESVAEE